MINHLPILARTSGILLLFFSVLLAGCGDDCEEVGMDFTFFATRATGETGSFEYTLEILAKDSAYGNVLWAKTVLINSSKAKITVPVYYPFYSFKAMKGGYVTHRQYYRRKELMFTPTLAFDFIPESLDGFYRYRPDHPSVFATFYFPNEANRCRLYARADYDEGYFPEMIAIGQAGVTKGGFPISTGGAFECLLEWDASGSTCYNRVNLHDNQPYQQALNFCDSIDLTKSSTTHSLDDVDIAFYLAVSAFNSKGKPTDFQDDYLEWKGLNNQ